MLVTPGVAAGVAEGVLLDLQRVSDAADLDEDPRGLGAWLRDVVGIPGSKQRDAPKER